MDTIISTHGFQNTAQFASSGGLEVFYFTKQYGATRWEAWAPAAQNRPPQQQQTCTGPTTMTYQGMAFTLVDCRDWSTTVLLSAGWEIDPTQSSAGGPNRARIGAKVSSG